MRCNCADEHISQRHVVTVGSVNHRSNGVEMRLYLNRAFASCRSSNQSGNAVVIVVVVPVIAVVVFVSIVVVVVAFNGESQS